MANNTAPARAMTDEELLYRAVEQLTMIANTAKTLSEMHLEPVTEESAKTGAEAVKWIFDATRGMDTNSVLARLTVALAAGAKSKHMVGATLTCSKVNKIIHLKAHYGHGKNDFQDLNIDVEVAKKLRDGLTQGIGMIAPEPRFVMPDNNLVQ